MENNIKIPAGGFLRIEALYAFIANDEKGEGIMGVRAPTGNWVPLVGADMDRIKSLIPLAEMVKKNTGTDYKIVKFSKRELIEL